LREDGGEGVQYWMWLVRPVRRWLEGGSPVLDVVGASGVARWVCGRD
jgi:hypothetical protein